MYDANRVASRYMYLLNDMNASLNRRINRYLLEGDIPIVVILTTIFTQIIILILTFVMPELEETQPFQMPCLLSRDNVSNTFRRSLHCNQPVLFVHKISIRSSD